MLTNEDKDIIHQRVRVKTANLPERLRRDVGSLHNQAAARGMYLSGSTKAQTGRLYRQHFEIWAQQVFDAHAEVCRLRGYHINDDLRVELLASIEQYLGHKADELKPALQKQAGDLYKKAPEHFTLPVRELLDRFDSELRLWGLESPAAIPANAAVNAPIEKRDLFLCHASEDKQSVVIPFKEAAVAAGFSCWIDQGEIRWGDSLIKKINAGLAGCRYVVVFISETFLRKNWPQAELDAALSIEISSGRKVVLPLFIVEADKVFAQYPLLSPKLYKRCDEGLPALMDAVREVLAGHADWTPPTAPEPDLVRPRNQQPPPPAPPLPEVAVWEPVRSSNIAAVRYTSSKNILEIKFLDGGVYEYTGVPESVYRGLMGAHSKGSYFHAHIKDRFRCRKIG